LSLPGTLGFKLAGRERPARKIPTPALFVCRKFDISAEMEQELIIMARFPEAENRLLNMKICMNCNARNPVRATRCRKCGYSGLRMKSKESRSA
jgi:large subunit ribosomal protein L40e